MRKPIILLGKGASGKTQLALLISGNYNQETVVFCDYTYARRITNFLITENKVVMHCLIIESVPDVQALETLHEYLKGIAVGTGIQPLIIYTSNSICETEPLPQFRKHICSYNLWLQKFNEKYGSDRG